MDNKSASSWQKAPPENEIFFEEVLKEHPDAEKRRMFGYPCAFIHGDVFSGCSRNQYSYGFQNLTGLK